MKPFTLRKRNSGLSDMSLTSSNEEIDTGPPSYITSHLPSGNIQIKSAGGTVCGTILESPVLGSSIEIKSEPPPIRRTYLTQAKMVIPTGKLVNFESKTTLNCKSDHSSLLSLKESSSSEPLPSSIPESFDKQIMIKKADLPEFDEINNRKLIEDKPLSFLKEIVFPLSPSDYEHFPKFKPRRENDNCRIFFLKFRSCSYLHSSRTFFLVIYSLHLSSALP